MRRRTGPTRKERREQAERLLRGLLRTPKTRAGLIAAAETVGVTKNFVYGFLSEAMRSGSVTMLLSVKPVQYQATDAIVVEQPSPGEYPPWLEPRVLPACDRRRIHIDGAAVQQI